MTKNNKANLELPKESLDTRRLQTNVNLFSELRIDVETYSIRSHLPVVLFIDLQNSKINFVISA